MSTTEIIESKQCPRCKKVYTFLKFKYNAGALIGGYVASASLFFFSVIIVLLKPFLGLVLAVSCYVIYRQSAKVVEMEDKAYYWHCYKCKVDFRDRTLSGKTFYYSKRPSRAEIISQTVKEKLEQDKQKAAY